MSKISVWQSEESKIDHGNFSFIRKRLGIAAETGGEGHLRPEQRGPGALELVDRAGFGHRHQLERLVERAGLEAELRGNAPVAARGPGYRVNGNGLFARVDGSAIQLTSGVEGQLQMEAPR